jgi:hypothetical protein
LALTSDQNQSFVLSGLQELIELLGHNKVASDGDYAAVWGKDDTDFETMSRGWFTVVLHVSDDEATADRVKAGLTSYFEG